MYLSDRDIAWAVKNGDLILPEDAQIDPTSVDLPLDSADQAKIWDVQKLSEENASRGQAEPEVRLGKFKWADFSGRYLRDLPVDADQPVHRRGDDVVVKPGGFLLWQTRGDVGTPDERADLICFVNGKSTRARTGLLVHFTAPTIHARWHGHIVLEIANLGPFHFVLREGDVIAQLTVARITSSPSMSHGEAKSVTHGQTTPGGHRSSSPPEPAGA